MTKPEITITPLPPTQGQTATIGYTGKLPATLHIRWTPKDAGPAEITIPESGSLEIQIPENAEAMVITDPSGEAAAQSTMIQS